MELWSKVIFLVIQVIWHASFVHLAGPYFLAFENCNGFSATATPTGSCSISNTDSAVGAYSLYNVRVQGGYLDYGTAYQQYGCPFTAGCPTGWSYYGWLQFSSYPTNCTDFAVIISSPMFNLHLLGNGHLAAYTWLPNGTEYYAESVNPVLLNIWYPVFLEFKNFTANSSNTLSIFAQGQLIAMTQVARQRTYTPPTSNLVFGGTGITTNSKSANVKFDRSFFDTAPKDVTTYFQSVMDVAGRWTACTAAVPTGKAGIMTRNLTCYWVETAALSWSSAYNYCQTTAYANGYPYAKLAQFPTDNATIWTNFKAKLASYGNGTAAGFPYWIGGGQSLKWLNVTGQSLNLTVTVPADVTYNNATSTSTSCLQVTTKAIPWQWSETTCTAAQKYICSASYDCVLDNPCKNLGACLPVNDGVNMCQCWPGTSGRFCENGAVTTNYIPSCTSTTTTVTTTTPTTAITNATATATSTTPATTITTPIPTLSTVTPVPTTTITTPIPTLSTETPVPTTTITTPIPTLSTVTPVPTTTSTTPIPTLSTVTPVPTTTITTPIPTISTVTPVPTTTITTPIPTLSTVTPVPTTTITTPIPTLSTVTPVPTTTITTPIPTLSTETPVPTTTTPILTTSTITTTIATTTITTAASVISTVPSTTISSTTSVSPITTTAATNCTDCKSALDGLLKLVSQYKMKLKLKLIDINVEQDEFESWECNQTFTFTKLSEPIFNQTSNETDCTYIWQLFTKFLLKRKIVRWFMRIIARKNPTGFPSDLSNDWTSINQSFQSISTLTCFVDVITGQMNDTVYQPVIDFCNHDDDDHYDNDGQHDDGGDDC